MSTAGIVGVAHFYHVYADGDWRDPVAEHLAALKDSKFDGYFGMGVVGTAENYDEVWQELDAIRTPDRIACAPSGWEQVTLALAAQFAAENDGSVLYAHTKGAARKSAFQNAWRQNMTALLVSKWQDARDALATGHYDAVGCHWLTERDFPHVKVQTDYPMFGGNFWMATCEYIRSLPPLQTENRHQAESWIGKGEPRVLDLSPGWPGHIPFPRRKMRRLVASFR